MRKFTALPLAISFLFVGCVGKWADAPEKQMVLDGYPMSVRVVHDGPEFEILSAPDGGLSRGDNIQGKRLAIRVADAEAAGICDQKGRQLIEREMWAPPAWVWVSRYRCD